MAEIVCRGRFTSRLAKGWVEGNAGENLRANVCIVRAVAGIWSVNRAAAKRRRASPTGAGLEGIVHIAIRASDDDLEVVSPLTAIVGIVSIDRTSPENTFDIGRRRRIIASGARSDSRISFEV